MGEFIGVDEASLPTIRLLDPSDNMKKYTYSGKIEDITVESLKKFIDDFNNKNLQPFLKSAEAPADDQALLILVGKTFKEKVIDSQDDLLIKFYAPWCGHCKTLAPIWDQLAEDLKDVKGLRIAKFDATANEVEGLDIKGYPTLKFYHKGKKDAPVDFDGGRELENFKEWLKEHSEAYKKYLENKTDL